MNLRVRPRPGNPAQGLMAFGGEMFPCALGRSGLACCKREGDGKTPAGRWHLRRVLFRPDRVTRPQTRLPVDAITHSMGWCDAPSDRNYNRAVPLPYPSSCERLWREDHLYDLVAVLSHNEVPRRRGRGSAIFLHLAREGYTPTQGCVALSEAHLRRVLAACSDRTQILIGG